jgi:hypothetical protein
MGRINILDTKTVVNSSNSVISTLSEIRKVKDSIDKILSELNAYWAENGDQQQFAQILSSELGTLQEMIDCTGEFCSATNDYIKSIEATSSNVASGN